MVEKSKSITADNKPNIFNKELKSSSYNKLCNNIIKIIIK